MLQELEHLSGKKKKKKKNLRKKPEEIRLFFASEDYSFCATPENPPAL